MMHQQYSFSDCRVAADEVSTPCNESVEAATGIGEHGWLEKMFTSPLQIDGAGVHLDSIQNVIALEKDDHCIYVYNRDMQRCSTTACSCSVYLENARQSVNGDVPRPHLNLLRSFVHRYQRNGRRR